MAVNDFILLGLGGDADALEYFVLTGLESSGVEAATPFVLHAAPTSMLYHAEKTAGEINTLYFLATLVDEDGDTLVDQNGNILIAFGETPVIVLHAAPTSTLIHAEETYGDT